MKMIDIGLNGLGAVGLNFLKILADKTTVLADRYDLTFRITMAADSSGLVYQPGGLAPADLAAAKSGPGLASLDGFSGGISLLDTMTDSLPDIILEASPVDLQTGGPGLRVTQAALSRGKSVVLANKAPVVLAFRELADLMQQSGGQLRYSATVCGGLPILNVLERDMIAGSILKVRGVFNSTTNFILEEMAADRSFDEALAEAQARGIAEADPSLDIGGWDTANKLVVIANTIGPGVYGLDDISVSGIDGVTQADVKAARKADSAIRLVAEFTPDHLSVSPQTVPADSFIGQCSGWEMGVQVHSDIYGIGYYKLWEREPVPTAAAMLRDTVHIAEKL